MITQQHRREGNAAVIEESFRRNVIVHAHVNATTNINQVNTCDRESTVIG